MISYWDTSAAVALFFEEPNSSAALQARAAFKIAHMWAGSRVELEAAVVRRDPAGSRLPTVVAFAPEVHFHEITPVDLIAVVALNRRHRLRAAVAGHLYYSHRLSRIYPDAQLVCFNTELCAAARAAKLQVWPPVR